MNRYLLILAVLIVPFAFFATSCGDEEEVCSTSNVTYTNDVKAILDASCALSGCHNAGNPNGSLANYADADFFASFGRISGSINHDDGFEPMPYPTGTSKLSDCEISKIDAWLAAGRPE